MPCCRRANYLVSLLTYRLSSTPHPCNLFGINFNVIANIFSTNSPPLLQKIDSREGLFGCKMGLGCECSKMNIYYKQQPFAPVLGLFAAKHSAICR